MARIAAILAHRGRGISLLWFAPIAVAGVLGCSGDEQQRATPSTNAPLPTVAGWDGRSPGEFETPALLADAFGCETFEARGVLSAEGRAPAAVGTCTIDGGGITVQVVQDAAAIDQWHRDAETVCVRGASELHYVVGDRWLVTTTQGPDKTVAARIADELDAELVSVIC